MHVEIDTALFRAGRPEQAEQLLPDLGFLPRLRLESIDDRDSLASHSRPSFPSGAPETMLIFPAESRLDTKP